MAEAQAYSLKNDGPAFKLAIRLSETREKLNTLAQSETLTEDQDQEMRSLTDSYPQLEAKWRAAAQVEQAGKVIVGGEANELRQLEQRVELRSYMHSLMNEKPPQGAELELQQHYNLGVNQIPWAALDPLQEHRQRDMGPEEHRADTVTAGSATVGNQQQDIIRRVFCHVVRRLHGCPNAGSWCG